MRPYQPIDQFLTWQAAEIRAAGNEDAIHGCLSTNGLDGFPNARFVALKEIRSGCFVVAGDAKSRKGQEFANSPKVALTFWWPVTGRQVRIQGEVRQLPDYTADIIFQGRTRASQWVAMLSNQGMQLIGEQLKERYQSELANDRGEVIEKPEEWHAWAIEPRRIELFEFDESRFHRRELYSLEDGEWQMMLLQP